ncbi:helix-turn-helix transcriptional regulator [Paenibacillus protaetiae]|uniref:AraC family transcriptional regulator n=1 Tax=Paenibacillus protaetiae TaxID=2509456 RepID=A0A4P6EQZ5_9BACL|nr:AraC family transcriptional regulator [Paenibacillus protaetiae]QAY65272.1 AraC family transcriptional regulator [Paenibacillus protaetiae]
MHKIDRLQFELGLYSYSHKLKSDASRWYHAHQGIEMLYVFEGEGHIMLEGKPYPLQNGTLIWVQPYQLHLVDVPARPGNAYIRTNLTFDPYSLAGCLAAFPELHRFYNRIWKDNLPVQIFWLREDHSELLAILEEFDKLRSEPSAQRDESFGLLMLRLLRFLQRQPFRGHEADMNASPRMLKHMESMTDWLEQHYREPFRLEEMARDLFLSPYHLSHLCKEATGITLSEQITLRRMKEACALLAGTSKTIQEIAKEVGGLSPSYFCQMFKKNKGVTPEQYRRTIRSGLQR